MADQNMSVAVPPADVQTIFDTTADKFAVKTIVAVNRGTAAAPVDPSKTAQTFESVLNYKSAKKYAPLIFQTAILYGLSPLLVFGVGDHESSWGDGLYPAGPAGTSSNRQDLGLMQINLTNVTKLIAAGQFTNWQDPAQNIAMGCYFLKASYAFFQSTVGPVTYKDANGVRHQIGGKNGITDPRPLSGELLTRAALAGYNAPPQKVLGAIAAGQDPDSVTTDGKTPGKTGYGQAILNRVSIFSRLLFARGSVLGSSEPLASIIAAPAANGFAMKGAYRELYDQLRGAERGSIIAYASRKDLYDEQAAFNLRKNAQTKDTKGVVAQAVPTYSQPPPAFLQDANYPTTAYNFETGLWEDGKPA